MSKRQKHLAKIRQNIKNASWDDLRAVLEDFGFVFKHVVGSHYTLEIELEGQTYILVVPFSRPIKSMYVKKALGLIDRVIVERGLQNDSE